jgi:hypothetical protein
MPTETTSEHPESIETLLVRWEQEYRRRRRLIFISGGCAMGGILVGTIIQLTAIYGHKRGWWGKMPDAWRVVLEIARVAPVVGLAYGLLRTSHTTNRMLNRLLQTNDVRVVGPLLAALFNLNGVSEAAIANALCRLLPQMQASDAAMLTAEHRRWLHRCLSTNATSKFKLPDLTLLTMADLQIAVLKAMEQVGDEAALPHVEALAEMETKDPERSAVRDAARACLPFLYIHIEQAKIGQELLRAAGDPVTDHLLVAASGLQQEPKEQLLRADIFE